MAAAGFRLLSHEALVRERPGLRASSPSSVLNHRPAPVPGLIRGTLKRTRRVSRKHLPRYVHRCYEAEYPPCPRAAPLSRRRNEMARQPRQPALIQRDCPFCLKPVDPNDPKARHEEKVSWHPKHLSAAVKGGLALNGRAR